MEAVGSFDDEVGAWETTVGATLNVGAWEGGLEVVGFVLVVGDAEGTSEVAPSVGWLVGTVEG